MGKVEYKRLRKKIEADYQNALLAAYNQRTNALSALKFIWKILRERPIRYSGKA